MFLDVNICGFGLVVAQSLSCVQLFATPRATEQASLFFTHLPEFAQTQGHRITNAIQPSHPLPPPLPHAFNSFPASGFFSNKSALCIRWPKYLSFSFSISPSSEYSGLISFRMDWFDLAVQRTHKNLLQHQFESISSSTLRLLYGPTLTFIYDHWKKHSFDYKYL